MSRYPNARERLFRNWYDSIVDNGEGIDHVVGQGMRLKDEQPPLRLPSRALPEQLWFFRSSANIGTTRTNMEYGGALSSDQTALFFGCTLVLMMETPDAQLMHLLQQSNVNVQLGCKVTDYPLVAVKPFSDLPSQQCALRADFGAEPPADLFEKQNALITQKHEEFNKHVEAGDLTEEQLGVLSADLSKSIDDIDNADHPYAPHLPARQGFGIRLEVPDGFRAAWAAHKGPKTLRLVLHTRTTRDCQ